MFLPQMIAEKCANLKVMGRITLGNRRNRFRGACIFNQCPARYDSGDGAGNRCENRGKED